ncbi:MAG: hypothetical protein AB7L65_04625 [Hyphomonadaceae bacterium]
MSRLIYEVRLREGKWCVLLGDAALFRFEDKAEAIARLDDLAVVGARGKDLEIRVYDENDALVERHSGLDYEI